MTRGERGDSGQLQHRPLMEYPISRRTYETRPRPPGSVHRQSRMSELWDLDTKPRLSLCYQPLLSQGSIETNTTTSATPRVSTFRTGPLLGSRAVLLTTVFPSATLLNAFPVAVSLLSKAQQFVSSEHRTAPTRPTRTPTSTTYSM